MLKKPKKTLSVSNKKAVTRIKTYKGITEFRLANGLTILHKYIEGTGVITTNITYRVGARDEQIGETGLAHMLEHMLFKPTEADIKLKIDSGAMHFERETGCTLNANTWKDRTTYYFSYPKEHFTRALRIEAERMTGVVLTDTQFQPERGNVLSEFDMYFGDPYFALSLEIVSAAYHSHPYGHETIGFREDIERYTTEKLKSFYERFYDPSNATLMIIGDVKEAEAIKEASTWFSPLTSKGEIHKNAKVAEPKQEGLRRATIVRPSTTNVVAFGVKHAGFPEKEWFQTTLLGAILTNGPDSILFKKLVDTGLASRVEMAVEPTQEENVGVLYVTMSQKATHAQIEKIVFETIASLTSQGIALAYKKTQQKILTEEIIGRGSSLKIAMELTEYVSAQAWERFFDTEEIIKSITAKDIVIHAHKLFDENKMVIAHFIGKK